MEALVLAAGAGKRNEPISSTKPKCLFPILGKPLLHYIAKSLFENDIKMIIVANPSNVNIIKKYFPDAEYVIQEKPLGTANAVAVAKDKIKGDEFLVINGDIIFEENAIKKVIQQKGNVIAAVRSEEPWKVGTLVIKNEKIVGIVEKEVSITKPALVNAGIYKFSKEIFKFIEKTEKSPRNELELTTSITKHIFEGGSYSYVEISGWKDITFPNDLIEANKIMFKKAKSSGRRISGKVEGKVIVEEGARVTNSRIKDSYIGKNCIIEDSVIENSFISENVKIYGSYIKDSVIMENTTIYPFCYVPTSVICENVKLGSSTVIADEKFDEKEIKIRVGENEIAVGKRFGCVIGANSQIGVGTKIMPGKKIGRNCIVYPMSRVTLDVPDFKKFGW
jgi:bifunctional UDP-N-acetylglucosamine pyrophosphorylase/glucosamine-1-phosphate N-acetyltransferase